MSYKLSAIIIWIWGDGLVGKALTAQACRTEWESTTPTEMCKPWACMANPRVQNKMTGWGGVGYMEQVGALTS